jgi:hypothetical protein
VAHHVSKASLSLTIFWHWTRVRQFECAPDDATRRSKIVHDLPFQFATKMKRESLLPEIVDQTHADNPQWGELGVGASVASKKLSEEFSSIPSACPSKFQGAAIFDLEADQKCLKDCNSGNYYK